MISFIPVLILTTLLSSMVGFVVLKNYLKRSADIAEMTGVITGTLISYMNGEFENSDKNYYVKLNAALYEMVRDSRDRQDSYRIEEVFFIDKSGKLLAHSDISRIAKNSGADYNTEKYLTAAYRPISNPHSVRIDSILSYDGSYPRKIYDLLKEKFPDLLAERYHIGVAVYPVDTDISRGSVHVMIQNTTFKDTFNRFKFYTKRALIAVPVFSAACSFLVFIFVLLFGGTSSGRPLHSVNAKVADASDVSERLEIYDVMNEDEDSSDFSGNGESIIPDAIPLYDSDKGKRHA